MALGLERGKDVPHDLLQPYIDQRTNFDILRTRRLFSRRSVQQRFLPWRRSIQLYGRGGGRGGRRGRYGGRANTFGKGRFEEYACG